MSSPSNSPHDSDEISIPEEMEFSESLSTFLTVTQRPSLVPNVSSFASMNVFREEFFPQKSVRRCKGVLTRSTRRILRLCLFGLLLPVVLISVPLYVRLVLYPPSHFMMAPTDQRLLSHTSSSVWCQSERVHMNGSFNAFLLSEPSRTKKRFSTHSMLQHMTLKDDVKEYWGFFLQKGSVVSINLCIRYDGGILMIMKGSHNLRTCAWIGKEDSTEQDEDHIDTSNESGQQTKAMNKFPMVSGEILVNVKEKDGFIASGQEENVTEKTNLTSEERKEELDYYIEKVLTLSKSRREIYEGFNRNKRAERVRRKEFTSRNLKEREENSSKTNEGENNGNIQTMNETSLKSKNNNKENKMPLNKGTDTTIEKSMKNYRLRKVKRYLEKDTSETGEIEITNNEQLFRKSVYMKVNNSSFEIANSTLSLYLNLLNLPKELTYIKGSFNQTHRHDNSNEEHESSFSSSEESLTNCEGLIGILPLHSSRMCHGFNDSHANRIRYGIPVTGTYYFVFSSDNEVFDSDVYFNMTLKRVVYNTEKATESCVNKSDCSLSFSFWSHDQTVVEVPEGDWNTAYVMEVKCQPRVAVYLGFLFLIPVLILFCAFH